VIVVEFAMSPDGRTRLAEAPPLLVVELTGAEPDSEPALVPFVNAQLVSVDIAARRIVMQLPAGLVDGFDMSDTAEDSGEEESENA
jgi:16S rRNA processing protein RimM